MFATGKDVCSCQPQHRSHPTLQLSWSERNWGLIRKAIVQIYNSFMWCILVSAGDPNFEQNTENEEKWKWANCPFDQCWFAGCSYNQHPDNKAACLAKRTRWDTSFRIRVLLPFIFPLWSHTSEHWRRKEREGAIWRVWSAHPHRWAEKYQLTSSTARHLCSSSPLS